ncbi:hypothetical protein WJX73_008914 [Symbiochloris irregularis]|uniref:ABC-type xenobiotic transporter n=1 Tax=Symbiochloris irregularis TaxID=706552 RepID=A0AAW1NTE0_9CHLO
MQSDALREPFLPYGEETERRPVRGWISSLGFCWIGPVLTRGSASPLAATDLVHLEDDLQPRVCSRLLWTSWTQERTKQLLRPPVKGAELQPSLLSAVFATYGWPYLALGLLKLGSDALNFAGPLLLNQLILYLQADDEPESPFQGAAAAATAGTLIPAILRNWGYVCVGALCVTSVLKAILNTQYTYGQGRISCQMRSALTCAIAIALYLLWTQVRGAFVAGLVVVLLLIPANRWLAKRIEAASVGMMAHKDLRIKATAELLRGIRQIKASAWEAPFLSQIDAARTGELQALAVRKYLDALCVCAWAATSLLFSIATFGTFIVLGHELSASIVFTSLALFNVLIAPLNAFPWVINGIVEAVVSVRRLQKFLLLPEIKATWAYSQAQDSAPSIPSGPTASGVQPSSSYRTSPLRSSRQPDVSQSSSDSQSHTSDVVVDVPDLRSHSPQLGGHAVDHSTSSVPMAGGQPVLRMREAAFAWAKASGKNGRLLPGTAGAATLRDINLEISCQGGLTVILGSPGSGKSALLTAILGELVGCGGSTQVTSRVAYAGQEPWIMSASVRDNIIFGRRFDQDRYLQVVHACALEADLAQMPAGDATQAGDRGAKLSGGQRARIAMARALYEDSDLYLLDDVLAAVDAHAADGPGLATASSSPDLQAFGSTQAIDMDAVLCWLLACIILGSLALMQATRNGSDLWLSYWVASIEEDFSSPHSSSAVSTPLPLIMTATLALPFPFSSHHSVALPWQNHPLWVKGVLRGPSRWGGPRLLWHSGWSLPWLGPDTSFYFTVLLLLAAANCLFTLVRAFSFAAGGLAAAGRLHQGLLEAVSQAPISFFDSNPTGRILNRFSSDVVMADDSLPFILNIFLANAAAMLGILAVLLLCQPLLVVCLLPLACLYILLQRYYQSTAREVRRLSSLARSPVYGTFGEALHGATTIRAFAAQTRMAALNQEQVGLLQRANITALALQQWLSLRLQLLAAAVVTAVALLGVLQHQGRLPDFLSHGSRIFGAGAVGLSLSYALPLTGLLNGLLTSSAETEQELVSVERVLEYTHVPHQPMIGICGRTGAGKSSLLGALLRLTELEAGSIRIGGVDISGIPLMRLRREIGYIPQTAFLFEGTIRSNLDPMEKYPDRELIAVLKHVRLWDVLCGLSLSHAKASSASPQVSVPRTPAAPLSAPHPAGTPPMSPRSHSPRSPTKLRRKADFAESRRAARAESSRARSPSPRRLARMEEGSAPPHTHGGHTELLSLRLGEHGSGLSQGQQQQLAVARVLLQRPSVVLLDECSAAVDAHVARQLQGLLHGHLAGSTIIQVAHRVDTVLACDLVAIKGKGDSHEMRGLKQG